MTFIKKIPWKAIRFIFGGIFGLSFLGLYMYGIFMFPIKYAIIVFFGTVTFIAGCICFFYFLESILDWIDERYEK